MTREEAAREINGLIISAEDEDGPCIFSDQIEALEMAIEVLEQPEIIRCKDCEYWGQFPDYHSFCLDGAKSYDPEGFCHFARRREE